MMKYIITHAGGAHRDEVLAVALALNLEKFEGEPRVYRRDPTPDELQDPRILVLDVGGDYSAELNNFDHHQFEIERVPVDCALSLYAQDRDLDGSLRYQKWYRPTILIDMLGPFKAAKELGLPRLPMELLSPIEGALISIFGKQTPEVAPEIVDILTLLGKNILDNIREYASIIDDLKSKVKVVEISGVETMVLEQSGTMGLQDIRDSFYPEAGISILHDDRGEGWILYRFNDDTRVDFSRLEGDPRILFAHKGGFIAKTLQRIPLTEVFALADLAINKG